MTHSFYALCKNVVRARAAGVSPPVKFGANIEAFRLEFHRRDFTGGLRLSPEINRSEIKEPEVERSVKEPQV